MRTLAFTFSGQKMMLRSLFIFCLLMPFVSEAAEDGQQESHVSADVSLPDYRQAKWPFITRDAIFDIALTDKGEGVIVGRGGLMAHRAVGEGGWRIVPMADGENFFAVTHDASGVFWVAGDGGRIWKKTPDADIWRSVELPIENAVFSLEAANDGTLMAVGEFGAVLTSKDGGESWAPENVPWADYLSEAWAVLGEAIPHLYNICLDPHTGDFLVTGEYGLVLRRTQQGWQKLRGGRIERAVFACVVSAGGQMVAVGQQGLALRSLDRGRNWQAVDMPHPYDLFDVAEWQGELIAVGAKGGLFMSHGDRRWKVAQKELAPVLGNSWFVRAEYEPDGRLVIAGDQGKLLTFEPDEITN